MSERNHYDAGAIHNDHHKEINIGSVSANALADIMRQFLKDEAEDAEVIEEVPADNRNEPNTPQNEMPQQESLVIDASEVKKSFRFDTEFVKDKVKTIVTSYYNDSAANLALIEIALYHHGLLIKRNYHKSFVTTLVSWKMISVADETELKKLISAVTDKYNRVPNDGYLKWNDGDHKDDKTFCKNIGRDLGDTIPYKG